MCYITVFTPTYNRAYCLENLYKSLLRQTNRDFEWLIVDDGSSDGTERLVEKWKMDNHLPITYIKTLNGGKHRAINKGVTLARGKYFFIVDSDDYLTDDAIEIVFFYGLQVENNDSFAGVCGLKIFPDGRKVGGEANYEILDTDSISFREKYKVKGDMAEIFKTEVLKLYPFPEFPGENFIKESVVWDRIALKYRLRYFYKAIYICDYLPDGLTHSIRRHLRRNPFGTMLRYRELCSLKNIRFLTRIKGAINYWRYTCFGSFFKFQELKPYAWMYLFYPLGVIFYFKDSCMERKR